jgi:ketosteroid isomerase-like protein
MTVIFTSAEDAEEAFYEAIGRTDLEALMSVWADDDEIVCIHPTGQRLTGPAAIRESWQAIFANNPRLSVRATPSVRWKGVMLDVHSVIETLYLGDEPIAHGPMLSTNVFQRGPDGWRLLSRHTSAAADDGSSEAGAAGGSSRPHTLH